MFNHFLEKLNKETRTKYFFHTLAILALVSIFVFIFFLSEQKTITNRIRQNQIKNSIVNPFEEISIDAKSVVVWDILNQRIIYGKNEELPLPLASLTKVMTALTSKELSRKDTEIKIAEEYLKPEGDSKFVLEDRWKIKDLLDFTLITSSNDGALALASVIKNDSEDFDSTRTKFIYEMNKKADEIGLLNSRFFNEHGLDKDADRGGAYGTAYDMALLFEYVIKNHPDLLEATKYKDLEIKSEEKTYQAQNTNPFVNQIPNLIASKTGYTDLAQGNLVIAFDAGLNRPIIVAVLGSTQEGRFSDALKLTEASLKYLQQEK